MSLTTSLFLISSESIFFPYYQHRGADIRLTYNFRVLRSPTERNSVAKQSKTQKKDFNFEESLSELEELVERLEQGDQTLENSLKDFERGVELTRNCQTALQDAEQRVEQLIEKSGVEQLALFNSDSDDE